MRRRARAADERHGELRLVDVPRVVGGREDLRLVDVVDFYRFKYPCLGDVSDAAFRHNGNRDRRLDAFYHRGIAHARDAAGRADIGGDAFERHDGACAGGLGDFRLFGRCHVHYHAALEHLRKVAVQFLSVAHKSLLVVPKDASIIPRRGLEAEIGNSLPQS